jgi:hypothetical protein
LPGGRGAARLLHARADADRARVETRDLAVGVEADRSAVVSPGDLYVVWSQADGNNADLMLVENVR